MKYDIFTPGEVAKRLNVTTQTIYNLIKDGTLPASNIGGGHSKPIYRIKEEDFVNMVYTKHQVRHGKVVKTEITEVIEIPEVDVKEEIRALKEDLLTFLLRLEELEQKLQIQTGRLLQRPYFFAKITMDILGRRYVE